MTADQETIFSAIRRRPGISRKHLALECRMGDLQVSGALGGLLMAGAVLRMGNGTHAGYYIPGAPVAPVRT